MHINIDNDVCKKKPTLLGILEYELGLWCLTQLSTIFQLYRGGQYYC
jgi:hypothetical protein